MTRSYLKSSDWQYEQEWRILAGNPEVPENPNFLNKVFDGVLLDVKDCITGIYLGTMIKPENKTKIEAIAKEKNIPIYQKEMSPDKFELTEKLIWQP